MNLATRIAGLALASGLAAWGWTAPASAAMSPPLSATVHSPAPAAAAAAPVVRTAARTITRSRTRVRSSHRRRRTAQVPPSSRPTSGNARSRSRVPPRARTPGLQHRISRHRRTYTGR